MKLVLTNTTKHRRRALWGQMMAGKVQCRWAKISVRVKGKFASKFVCGAWTPEGLVAFGPQHESLEALMGWANKQGLQPENGTIKVA